MSFDGSLCYVVEAIDRPRRNEMIENILPIACRFVEKRFNDKPLVKLRR